MGVLLKQGLVSFLKSAELARMEGGVMGFSMLPVEGEGLGHFLLERLAAWQQPRLLNNE
jgi:hypothetical protein